MKFKKTEKEIIKTIVKYGGDVKSLADVINESHLLEKRGIAFATDGRNGTIFLKKNQYDYDDKEPLGYIADLVSLINMLIESRYLVIIPLESSPELIIGRKNSKWYKTGVVVVDDREFVQVDEKIFNWVNSSGEQIYWPVSCPEKTLPVCKTVYSWFTVSQELKDMVNNNFKTEEEIRFETQQRMTWISIAVAGGVGVLGLVISVISMFIRC